MEMSPKAQSITARPLAILLAISLLASAICLHMINSEMPSSKADLVTVYTGTQFIIRGEDPYSIAATQAIQTTYYGRPLTPADHVNSMSFAYPAYTAILFAPLALFPWPIARLIFLISMPVLMGLSALAWMRLLQFEESSATKWMVLLLSLVSWPCVWALRLQQPTLAVAVLLPLGCLLLHRKRDKWAGILLAIVTIKPQLVVAVIAWLLLWACIKGRWTFIASFAAALAALLAIAQWMLPGWFSRWMTALKEYPDHRHLYPFPIALVGKLVGTILLATLIVLGIAILWKMIRCHPESRTFGESIAFLLALTLCAIPQDLTMIYNYVLLLPAFLVILHTKRRDLTKVISLSFLLWTLVAAPLAFLYTTWGFIPMPLLVTAALIPILGSQRSGKQAEHILYQHHGP